MDMGLDIFEDFEVPVMVDNENKMVKWICDSGQDAFDLHKDLLNLDCSNGFGIRKISLEFVDDSDDPTLTNGVVELTWR